MSFLKHFRGVRFHKNTVIFPHTQVVITFDRAFFRGAWAIVKFNSYLKIRQWRLRLKPGQEVRRSLAFYPQPSGPWYNAWLAARMLDLDIVDDPLQAEFVFAFDDQTVSREETNVHLPVSVQTINVEILDISKRHVGDVFQRVFGYSISVEPLTHTGPMVEKSNGNGVHDGRIIHGPLSRDEVREDCVYQRLIDSTTTPGFSEDLRIAYVGGEIPVVFHKFKALDKRFGTDYAVVNVHSATDVFSANEIELLCQFCDEMGLEFGAVDIMRDKNNGQIYAVDVNKTCMPVLCLSLRTQAKVFKDIANALDRMLGRKRS